MQIVSVNKFRKGVNNTFIQQIILKESVTSKFLDYFKQLGKVKCYINFPRVFFRVDVGNKYIINGMLNNRVLEVIYVNEDYKRYSEELKKELLGFNFNYIENEVS